MNDKSYLKRPSAELVACFKDSKEYYAKLDLGRVVEFSGYYYNETDIEKVHARFKNGCIFVGDPALNLMVTNILILSEHGSDVGRHIQSLHTDSKGEGMLTSWLNIADLICTIGMVVTTDTLKLLVQLNEWQKQGVQEVYISWYEKGDNDSVTYAQSFEVEHVFVAPDNLFDMNRPNPNIKKGKSILNNLQGGRVITVEDLPELVPNKIEQCSQSFLQAAFAVAKGVKEVELMEVAKLVLIHNDGNEYPFSIPQKFNGVEITDKSLDSEDKIVVFIKTFLLDTVHASKSLNPNTTDLKVLIKNLKQIDFFYKNKLHTIYSDKLIDIFDKS